MKLQKKIILAVAATVLSSTTLASQLDYRHEWKGKTKEQANRVKLGTSFKPNKDIKNLKIDTSIEMKFAGYDNGVNAGEEGVDDNPRMNWFGNWELTETEFSVGATYKMDQWQFKPGMPVAMTDRKTTWKPQLKVVYKAKFGLETALRYRHEFANYGDPTDGDKDMDTGQKQNTPQKSKITLTGGYKIKSLPNLKLNYEANYIKSWSNVALYNNDTWEYDAGLIVGYQLGNWRPFAEVWSVDVSSKTDERQARYRAGIKYKF